MGGDALACISQILRQIKNVLEILLRFAPTKLDTTAPVARIFLTQYARGAHGHARSHARAAATIPTLSGSPPSNRRQNSPLTIRPDYVSSMRATGKSS